MGARPDLQTMKLLQKHLLFIKKKYAPEKILLFGRRARGDHLEESDIDLIVVSKKFEGVPFRDRMIEAYGFWNKKNDLEQICYTPKEFEIKRKQIGIVQQAVKEGVEL